MSNFFKLLLSVALSSALMSGQDTLARVYADRKNQAHVVYTNGKDVVDASGTKIYVKRRSTDSRAQSALRQIQTKTGW